MQVSDLHRAGLHVRVTSVWGRSRAENGRHAEGRDTGGRFLYIAGWHFREQASLLANTTFLSFLPVLVFTTDPSLTWFLGDNRGR